MQWEGYHSFTYLENWRVLCHSLPSVRHLRGMHYARFDVLFHLLTAKVFNVHMVYGILTFSQKFVRMCSMCWYVGPFFNSFTQKRGKGHLKAGAWHNTLSFPFECCKWNNNWGNESRGHMFLQGLSLPAVFSRLSDWWALWRNWLGGQKSSEYTTAIGWSCAS